MAKQLHEIPLGVHIWSFPKCGLETAAKLARVLELDRMDLGNVKDCDPIYISQNVESEAKRIKAIADRQGIRYIDAFPQIQPSYANNHHDPEKRQEYRNIFAGFFDFAERIGLEGVTLSPGRYWSELESPEASFDRAAEELRWAVDVGQGHNLKIRIEPHIGSVTWTPEQAVAMCKAVPGLSLTVDHAHFIFHAIPYEQIAIMYPYGTHWHARQAGVGQGQLKGDQGNIDFKRIIGDLQSAEYEGTICIEYGPGSVDVISETMKMRDELLGYMNS